MIKINSIFKKFPDFKLDYLNNSNIPRLRILFSKNNPINIGYNEILLIKEKKDNILSKIIKKENTILFVLWSNSFDELGINNINSLKNNKINIDKYNKNDVIKYDNDIYTHIFSGTSSDKEIIHFTDLIINNENYSLKGITGLDTMFFIFDKDLSIIINIYSFLGIDISSYDINKINNIKKNLNIDESYIFNDKLK